MTQTFYLWDTGPSGGAWNMAADHYLLYYPKEYPVLRFYQWNPAALTIGYAQALNKHVNLGNCTKESVSVFRRMTGGKAVVHDEELTYSFSGTVQSFPFSSKLMESYRAISDAFILSLKYLGINAESAPRESRSQQPSVSSCFAQPSAYEIMAVCRSKAHKCKILGSAQKRIKYAVLQHGSLLLRYSPQQWSNLLLRFQQSPEDRAAGIKDVLGYIPPLADIKSAVTRGFQDVFQVSFIPMILSDEEIAAIREFAHRLYPNLTLNLDSSTNPV